MNILNEKESPVRPVLNPEVPIPKLSDLIGQSVHGITSYNELDNTDQVVALIDEVCAQRTLLKKAQITLISDTTHHGYNELAGTFLKDRWMQGSLEPKLYLWFSKVSSLLDMSCLSCASQVRIYITWQLPSCY